MAQDLNEQFINPELQDNQEALTGPAESSLYELDVLAKADRSKFEEELSATSDKQIKDAYNTLGPIAKEQKIGAFIDDKGNLYEEDSSLVKETALQEKLPDPPTEEAKAKKRDEIKEKMDEEISGLDAKLDELIQSGQEGPKNPKRRKRWIEKETELIKFRADREFSDFVKGTVKDYTKKNKTEKETLSVLNNTSSVVQSKIQEADNAIRGLDLSKISLYSKDNINPEMEKSFQKTLNSGISTYEQFSDAFEKGKIENGAVLRIYDAWGYKSNVRAANSTPVYYQAIVGPNGEKSIEKVAEGVIDPITGLVLGAIKPISNMSAIDIDPELSSIAKYESLKNDISLRNDITPEEKAVKIKNLDERNTNGLKKLNAAYDSLMSPYSGLSKEVKLAILASTYPNDFKQKYAELSADSKSAEEASERVLRAFGGVLVSPVTATTLAVGAVEEGVKELSRVVQGKPEGVLPTGTLALEIQKNPEMAKYIDEVIVEAGTMSSQYLNSVEGLANLVSSAKAKMNNKDISSIIDQAKNVYPKIQEALQSFSNTSNKVKVNISAYEAGALRILKKSGYNAALNDYKNAINALSNSDNKDIRDAYRFITLQSNLLNTELDTTFSERYETLSEEDRNFINTIGKELRFNKSEILGMTYDEAEKVYQLGKRAQSLFPSAELEEYKSKNEQGVLDSISQYKQQFDMLKGSDIFSEKGKFILSRLNELDDEYNSAFSNTSMYSFPALTQDAAIMKNALAYTNPAYALGIGILNGIGDILGGLRETGQKLTGFSWDNFDANSRNISYSLGEFKKYLETVGDTGNYAFDISKSIGEAFPQMVGFAGSFIVGGPIGGASYLAATMTGPKMREAAAAGLGDMGQATYAILSMGIEFASELVTSETALFRAGKGKSVLTKELVEKIMAPKTRKEAFKEFANLLWKKGAKTAWRGTLEAFEEEVANKGNYLLQSFYNGMMNTSFNPTVFTAQESLDTLITMIGTSAMFKGVTKLKQMTAERTPIQESKKEFVAGGMDKTTASIMAALTTKEGVARTLEIVKRVESGQIKESELNMPIYEKVRDVLLPAAMSANFSPNLSIEQRTVALDNLVKASDVAQMAERGEISEEDAVNPIQTYNQNAQTALRDIEYAKKEFGIDGTAMREMAYQFFGLADMMTNKSGALDARTPEQIAASQVTQMDTTPLSREGFIGKLNEIYVDNEDNAAVKRAAQNAIAKNPEGFVASEIQSTKNLIEKAKADYELASKQGPAPIQLARIDDLNERLNVLENTKQQYLNSQQYATEISARPQQEGGQPSNLLQPQGTQEGQPQIGQGEGAVGETAQPSPDARNRNFSSQARQAAQQVRQMFSDAGMSNMYTQPMLEGQEVMLMDELAAQVMENEPASVRMLGQNVVDRVNKYIADTGLDSDVFAVRAAQQNLANTRINEAKARLIEAINQSNTPANTANKKAVKTLVERLKKAFPNVKVIMDKKGFQAAVKDEAARDLMTKGGVVYGRVLNGDVYLNPDYANYNTPIHEFGHLWLNAAKEIAPAVYNRGLELIRDSEYMAKLQADPLYQGLSAEELENEALATAIGDRGEQFVNDVQKQGFRGWMRRLMRKMAQYVGIFNMSRVELDLLTLDEYLNRANASLLAGEAVTFNKMSDRSNFMTRPEGLSVVDGWYSPIERRLLETKIEKQSANKWLGIVGSRDEAIYTGVKGWLEGKNPQEQVSKQDILDWMKENRIEIREVVKGRKLTRQDAENEGFKIEQRGDKWVAIAPNDSYDFVEMQNSTLDALLSSLSEWGIEGRTSDTKYSQYQLEGEKENYKEVLVTLPQKSVIDESQFFVDEVLYDDGSIRYFATTPNSRSNAKKTKEEAQIELNKMTQTYDKIGKDNASFKSSHFDESNILVHLRMNTRTDAEGNKVLFLEEVQSDWGQKGKKEGFSQPANILLINQLEKEKQTVLNSSKSYQLLNNKTEGDLSLEVFDAIQQVATNMIDNQYSTEESRKEDFLKNIDKTLDYWSSFDNSVPKLNQKELSNFYDIYIQELKDNDIKIKGYGISYRLASIENKVKEINKKIYDAQEKTRTPLAPFVTDTNAWTKLGLKMALREAVAQGADKIAWTTGEQQNERYDLSKQVDEITYSKYPDGTYQFSGSKNESQLFNYQRIAEDKLEDYVGKEVAQKIINGEGEVLYYGSKEEGTYNELGRTIKGNDLKVGGKGMKGFYDKIIPDVASALVKEITGQKGVVGTTQINNTPQQSVDVTPELAASVSEGMPMFMARQQEPSFKSQMIDLANAVMQRELSKGRTLEEARTIATSDVSASVIANATGKFDANAAQRQIEKYVDEAYNERKIAEQAAARQRRISQAYTNPEAQAIMSDANRSAKDIAASNVGKKNKVTSKQAYETILGQVKAAIDRMYANGTVPAGVSWIDMMSLAPAIASDAVRASFPAANRQRFDGEDMVMMTPAQIIRTSILGQAKAARELAYTGREVNAIFKALLSQMTNQFGIKLQFSPAAVKSIVKSIQDNVFSNASILNVSENAAEEMAKILEKAYRGKLAEETKKLFDKISSEAFKAQFIQVYAAQLKNITGDNINSTIDAIVNSDASLEDIARLNTMLKGITSTKEGQRERRVSYIAPALKALAAINPTVQQQNVNQYQSLLSKIKDLISKATGPNAQSISSLDYGKMLELMHGMEDVENRRQNIGAFTPEEQAEILKQYGILKLSPLGDIQQYVQARETQIKRDTALLVDKINEEKKTKASNIRSKIPNQLLYNQFLNMMSNLDDKYLSSISPEELLKLKSALTDIIENGNYNNFAYNEYIKSWKFKIRNEFRDWATSIAANRNSITKDGFSNMFKSKFKDFARVFGGAEGVTPSADLIEKAFDLLFFHQMDVEFNSGFDELGMGFLERELFGQLAVATDQALNQSQSNLAPLQQAMIALSDKSNRASIKKVVGSLWKTYNIKDSLLFNRFMAKMRRDTADGLYEEVSVRMAAIVANQIDHISNLREGDERIDMVLQRNILESQKVGQTFKDFFSTTSLSSKFKDFNSMVDLIAYAALTENGTKTLKDLTETELLNLLTPKQREGISKWREYIESNKELFEATQIITGKMNPALKNYIPRNVIGTGDITEIDDWEVYINGQIESGLTQQQLESRSGNVGKLNLNLNRVILNNAKTLNTLYYAKPFLDAVKGMGEAIEDIKTGNVSEQRPLTALMQGGEGMTDANEFSLAYAEGIKGALTNRVKDALLSNEKSVNDRFGAMYRTAASTQAFAAKMWLLSPLRQINDFLNNFVKTASVLAFETRKAKSLKAALRAFSPRKAYYESDKGVFKWEDYVDIADYTGSPVYKMMSLYADNFIYEFRKTPEQLQRQQRAAAWQDMAYKKIAWIEKFEDSFRRLEGESFDHKAFKDERGSYRALYSTSVQRASMAADSMVDKQYGLASVARQPLRLQTLVIPIIGSRAIRNTFGNNFMAVKKGSSAAMLTGFMQGYATRQFALVQSYVKQAFDTTTNDSAGQRLGYLTRALTEAVIPVYGYSMIRTVMSNLFTSVSAAISDAFDDEEEKKKVYKEFESKSGWEKYKKKVELAFYDTEEDAVDNLINTAFTLSINPQSQFLLRNAVGLAMFYTWKKRAVESMMSMDRKGVKEKKKDIKKMEQKMFAYFNIKLLNVYGGDEYNESVKTFYNADEAVAGWEAGMETLFGFSALTQVAGQVADISRLVNAAEGANVNKLDVALASGLQLYGIIFSNMYLKGGAGAFLSMLSGDATKTGRYMIGEQMRTLKDYNWDHRKEKPRQMIIYPGEKRTKKPKGFGGSGGFGGGSSFGGSSGFGGKGGF